MINTDSNAIQNATETLQVDVKCKLMFNWLTSLTDWRDDLARAAEDFVICRTSKQVANGEFSSPASSPHE